MSPAYEEIVASINPLKYKMKWSMDLGLPPDTSTGDDIWWVMHLQFITWRQNYLGQDIGYTQGITFTKKLNETDEPIVVPEDDVPRALIDRCIDYFENQ
jgi:hypothetical protein